MELSTEVKAFGGEPRRRHPHLVLAICCASVVVVVMDIAGVNVALPSIRRDLHASESGLQWTVDAYVLLLAGFLVLAGSTADPLLELRLFRSMPFSAAIVISLVGMCGFGAFLFVTTQYLQTVRGLSPLMAGLSLLPVGMSIAIVSPLTGRLVAARGARLPLVISGAALALAGGASLWLRPDPPLPAVLATYPLFGIFLGTVIAPITATALSGMPRSMAALATSLPSAARQTGTALGVAISGTIVASALTGGAAFTKAGHAVWWLTLALGIAILILALSSTGRRAARSARRAAALFDELDRAG